jgi:hypothetical protein
MAKRHALERFRKRFARRRSKGLMANNQEELFRPGAPQDVASIRAKTQRHGKMAAERWNQ